MSEIRSSDSCAKMAKIIFRDYENYYMGHWSPERNFNPFWCSVDKWRKRKKRMRKK